MSRVSRTRGGRLRTLAILLLALALAHPAAEAARAAQGGDASAPLDLAAITLTPADLERAGLTGYGAGFGATTWPDQLAPSFAETHGLTGDAARAFLDQVGFVRWYQSALTVPADATDPTGPIARSVTSYVIEFTDAGGATAAWSTFEDESGDPTATDLPLTAPLGDQAEATAYTGADPDTGEAYRSVDLSTRQGRLSVGVTVVDWTGAAPDLATSEALATLLLQRIAGQGGPGLGNQVPRLTGAGIQSSIDGYVLRDGAAVRLAGESADDAGQRGSAAASAGERDTYRLWQVAAAADPARSVWYFNEVMRFNDDASAQAWVAGEADRVTADSRYAGFAVDTAAPVLGDASLAYELRSADGASAFRGQIVRVGATVADIEVVGPSTPPAEAIAAIATAQVGCLRAGACLDPVPVPSSLQGYIVAVGAHGAVLPPATPGLPSTPAPPSTPAAGGTAGVYRSDRYGYTLTYDPAVWTLTPDTDSDAEEWIRLDSATSTVSIAGRPVSVSGPLESCIQKYLVDFDWDNSLWEAEPIDPVVVEGNRAHGTFALTDQVFGYTGWMAVDCRDLGNGTTLLISDYVSTESAGAVPPADVAAFETLLAGLKLDGASG